MRIVLILSPFLPEFCGMITLIIKSLFDSSYVLCEIHEQIKHTAI